MKAKKKLPIKLIIVLAVIAAVVLVAAAAMISASRSSHAAYVQSVMELNNSWVVTNGNQSGTISDAATQNIYLTSTKVSTVNVTVGQTVAVGDVLFTYDTEALKDEIGVAQLKLEAQQAQLSLAQKKLDLVSSKPSWSEYESEERQTYLAKANAYEAEIETQVAETKAKIASESDEDKKAVLNEQLQAQTYELNQCKYNLELLQKDTDNHLTYEVSDEEIKSATLNVQEVTTSVKETENSIAEIRTKINESSVKATMSGVVSAMSDSMTISSTQPFITITSINGLTVVGYVDEYHVQNTHVGDQIMVTSYMTGVSATATIVSVSTYPDQDYNENYYGQQASYYQYQASLEETDGFTPGDYVGVSMTVAEDAVVLDKIYVRTDEEGSYVFKDQDGKLVRCPVTVAQTGESEYLQILEGITDSDMIAYPYGKSAYAGNTTTTEQAVNLLSSFY